MSDFHEIDRNLHPVITLSVLTLTIHSPNPYLIVYIQYLLNVVFKLEVDIGCKIILVVEQTIQSFVQY